MALRKLPLTAAYALLCLNAFSANVHPGLIQVKRVYLLPMTSGLDQYLANRLTKVGRFEVVTDPINADAVFTDRLGPAFEEKWISMYPPPPKVEEVAPANADGTSRNDKQASEPKLDDVHAPPMTRTSSLSRARGNVFLVSRDGSVVWSHFKPAKNTRTRELDSTADQIADRLHKDLKVKH